jgi:cytochrome c oxidase subunit 2
MGPSRKGALRAFLTTASLLVLSACGSADKYPQTTFEPVSEFGRLLNSLFANTFWWTMGIMVLVEILLLVFVFKFRDRPDAPEPKQIHGHTGLEITWTLIPSIIVLFILVPTVKGIFTTQAKVSEESSLVVEVIGHQWWWEFRYPQLGVVTANELVIPINTVVDLQMHSADVIHSYWVPRVGGKRDVNPQPKPAENERARVNHLTYNVERPGYYLGQCAEFCGESHALMRTAAVALSQADFADWVQKMGGTYRPVPVTANAPMGAGTAEKVAPQPGEVMAQLGGSRGAPADTLTVADTMRQTPPAVAVQQPAQGGRPAVNALSPTGAPAPGRGVHQDVGPVPPGASQRAAMMPGELTLEQRGEQLFTTRVCVACHTVNGTSAKGVLGPNLTRYGMRRTVGAGVAPNTLENVERWIKRPQDMKPGALMPGAEEGAAGMPATGLKSDEIRAIAAYLKSLK